MNFTVIIAVIAAMFVLRFLRLNAILWFIAAWIGLFVGLKFGVNPPMPTSILNMFMAIITIAMFALLSSDSQHLREAKESLVSFMVERRFNLPLLLLLLLLPAIVAVQVYRGFSKAPVAPNVSRTIHPPPPTSIQFRGASIDLNHPSPLRELETSDPQAFASHVANGRTIYYENCVFCHGDNMGGDGIFAHAFNPIPANFNDATTIAMLQESYLFWRIAKGGPGLPSESTPWASAMPAWEPMLTEEEIWEVIAFLYDYTDQRPRSTETEH